MLPHLKPYECKFKTSAVVYNHIVNFMAAYVSGFITNKDFPDTILMDKEL